MHILFVYSFEHPDNTVGEDPTENSKRPLLTIRAKLQGSATKQIYTEGTITRLYPPF